MVAVTTLPQSRPLTRRDLESMPDDGHRYELLDGTLLVTPAPGVAHQDTLARLLILLRAACPPELLVLPAPFAVGLADDTELQPDLLVARQSDFTPRDLPGPPLLAVEIRSPSTWRLDLHSKKARYEAGGTQAYWVVDPNPEAPALTVWELVAGRYVEVAAVQGSEAFHASVPFDITVVPDTLVAPRA